LLIAALMAFDAIITPLLRVAAAAAPDAIIVAALAAARRS